MEQDLLESIDGTETFDRFDPRAALSAFYRAFNRRDLAAMREVWLAGDQASMSNPVGGIARGWAEIEAIYSRIFSGEARVEVAFHDYSIHDLGRGFVAVGRERGTLTRGGLRLDLAFRTTRVFRAEGDGWRQLHHHGSADDPVFLERYQSAVR
jgi:ketosteroid isomerase-like protein